MEIEKILKQAKRGYGMDLNCQRCEGKIHFFIQGSGESYAWHWDNNYSIAKSLYGNREEARVAILSALNIHKAWVLSGGLKRHKNCW